jgi:CubicO group peptidase (beta-lactamase class C family)
MTATVPEAHTQDAELAAFCRQLFPRADTEPGVLVAVCDDAVTHWAACGLADLEHAVPISAATRFEIGSIAKQLTVAVLDRVLGDPAAWDRPLGDFLPDAGSAGAITLRRLADHDAALRDYDSVLALAAQPAWAFFSQRDMRALVLRQSPPAVSAHYSNSHHLLLAEVVRAVSGSPLATVADQILFAPLGLRGMCFRSDPDQLVPWRARSACADGAGGWSAADTSDTTVGPHGVYSDFASLVRWEQHLRDGGVDARLRASAVHDGVLAQMWRNGRTARTYRGGVLCGHSGSRFGFRTACWTDADGTTVVVLANRPDVDADIVVDRVRTAFSSSAAMPVPPPVAPPRRPADGAYWSRTDGAIWQLTSTPDGLSAKDDRRTTVFRLGEHGWTDADGFVRLDVADEPGVVEIRFGAPAELLTALERVDQGTVPPQGDYESSELGLRAHWRVNADGTAGLRVGRGTRVLKPVTGGAWAAEALLVRGYHDGLRVDLPRARDIRFIRRTEGEPCATSN